MRMIIGFKHLGLVTAGSLALLAALGAAGAASAQNAGSSSTTGVVAGHAPGDPATVFDIGSHSAGPGALNTVSVLQQRATAGVPGPTLITQAAATANDTSSSSLGTLLTTRVAGAIKPRGVAGTADTATEAVASYADRLTISAADPTDHRSVTFHGRLRLQELEDAEAAGSHDFRPGDAFSATETVTMQLLSEGIGNSIYGSSTFASFLLHTDSEHSPSTINDRSLIPGFVDFALTTRLGEARDFDILMRTFGVSSVDDVTGRAFFSVDYDFSFGASWMGAGFVTVNDEAGHDTGRILRGLSAQSLSGIAFLEGGASDGVPEPSSWALAIAGFGLTGMALRRRRAGLVAG